MTELSNFRPSKAEITEHLSKPAFERLKRLMQRYETKLSDAHEKALENLVNQFSLMAAGYERKRLAFDLPAGTGKTTAVVAWIAELVQSPFQWSVMIAAGRIDDLCAIYERLIEQGVSPDDLGLVYANSSSKKATVPATHDNQNRQVLLVTHARVRGRTRDTLTQEHTHYKGDQRNLVIYDESLITSDHQYVEVSAVAAGLGALKGVARTEKTSDERLELIDYLEQIWSVLEHEKARQKQTGHRPQPLSFPPREAHEIQTYIKALLPNSYADDLAALLMLGQNTVRYIGTSQSGGIIKFEPAVPDYLRHYRCARRVLSDPRVDPVRSEHHQRPSLDRECETL